MWERRYGFPKPRARRQRRAPIHVGRSRQAARDQAADGRRACGPARSSTHRTTSSTALADARIAPRRERVAPALERDILALLQATMRRRCSTRSRNLLMRQGLQRFVLDTLTLAQSCDRRRLDARRAAGVRGASVHGAAAGRAAHGDQRVSAADRHAARAVDDVAGRAARARPADGRSAAGPGRRAMHFARRADAARRHPSRRARAQGACRRAVVFRRVPGAPGERRTVDAAPPAAADDRRCGPAAR